MKTYTTKDDPDPNTLESPEVLPQIIENAIAAYYRKDYEPLSNRITPDCLFLGAGSDLFRSANELEDSFSDNVNMPVLLMRDSRFRVLPPSENTNTCAVVVGTYSLYTDPHEPMIFSVKQRITVCCVLTKQGWKAFHIHSSNEWNDTDEGQGFPFRASVASYNYMRDILRAGRRSKLLPWKVELECGGETRYVGPNDIIYVEAHGKRSTVYCINDVFSFGTLLSDLEQQLPGSYLRVHRSFLVNTEHVTGIRRFAITMSNGTEIPIPERRYTEICRELSMRVAVQ